MLLWVISPIIINETLKTNYCYHVVLFHISPQNGLIIESCLWKHRCIVKLIGYQAISYRNEQSTPIQTFCQVATLVGMQEFLITLQFPMDYSICSNTPSDKETKICDTCFLKLCLYAHLTYNDEDKILDKKLVDNCHVRLKSFFSMVC